MSDLPDPTLPGDQSTARIQIIPDRFEPAWSGEMAALESGEVDVFPYVDLREALEYQYQTDAHFLPYACPGERFGPRLKKQSLEFFEIQSPGTLPELTVVSVDVDFPDHGDGEYGWHNRQDWPQEFRQWYGAIQDAMATVPELQTAGVYFTRGGLRYVWPLKEPVSAKVADSFLSQFYSYLENFDLPLDPACDQWNRLFRLPFVVRDGERQNYQMNLSDMRPLDWTPPDPLVSRAPSDVGSIAREDAPDPDTIDPPNLSDYKPFENYWFYRHLRNDLPFAEAGERHDKTLDVVYTIVSELETNDPLVPYQLIRSNVQAMQSPESKGDEFGQSEVWKICTWVCRVVDGAKQTQESRQKTFLEEQTDKMGCSPQQIRRRLILAEKAGSSYYVWDEHEGEYTSPTSKQSLLLAMLQHYAPKSSAISYREDQLSPPYLIRDYGQTIESVVLSYTADKTRYDSDRDRVVEAALSPDPNLEPKYHQEIEDWLDAMGGDRAEKLHDWLATFRSFGRATCAVYIHGPPGIGKGLLAAGLSRFWQSNPVPYSELTDDFQGSLVDSPLIVADEKVPEDPFRERGSSVFRRIIGSGNFKINRKHKSPADLVGFPRVMITANNADALQIQEALTEADISAIRERIGYIRTDSKPREVLEDYARSENCAVQEMTGSWVRGGKIAEHVMWKENHREVSIGDRFLVEGWESDLTKNLAISFGAAPLVGKFVARAIRERKNSPGLRYGDGQIYINLGGIRESWGRVMGQSSKPPGETSLMKALKVLSEGDRKRMKPDESSERRFYWQIDADKIARIAEEFYVTDAETVYKVVESQGPGEEPSKGVPMSIIQGGDADENG